MKDMDDMDAIEKMSNGSHSIYNHIHYQYACVDPIEMAL